MTRILLFDPDVRHGEVLAASLRGLGREVTCCSSQRVMARRLREENFDAVILYSYRSGDWKPHLGELRNIRGTSVRLSLPSSVLPVGTGEHGSEWMLSEKEFGWFMRDSSKLLLEEVDFVLAERTHVVTRGFAFKVVHRNRPIGADCVPGEEILGPFP